MALGPLGTLDARRRVDRVDQVDVELAQTVRSRCRAAEGHHQRLEDFGEGLGLGRHVKRL
jgi:hypothetical protein